MDDINMFDWYIWLYLQVNTSCRMTQIQPLNLFSYKKQQNNNYLSWIPPVACP